MLTLVWKIKYQSMNHEVMRFSRRWETVNVTYETEKINWATECE